MLEEQRSTGLRDGGPCVVELAGTVRRCWTGSAGGIAPADGWTEQEGGGG